MLPRTVSLLGAFACMHAVSAQGKALNIFLILTDDQDVKMDTSDFAQFLPSVYTNLVTQGTTLERAYAAVPVCCPSRSSLHTGLYQHNTGVLNNSADGQCAGTAWVAGPETRTGAVYLQQAGYRTSFSGKYLNDYGITPAEPLSHVPPGWDNWVALRGNSIYYEYDLSVNGTTVSHGSVYPQDYLPLVIRNATLSYVASVLGTAPVYAVMSFPSCHQPADPEPQYADLYPGAAAPRHPNFNTHIPDTHWFESNNGVYGPLDANAVSYVDLLYRRRLQTLRSVDDAVQALVDLLTARGALDDSVIVYTSDNGYHLGNGALSLDKRQPWDYDTHIPLVLRGPGVPRNASVTPPVSHVDLMPTFLTFAGASVPPAMDGLPLQPLLSGGAWPRDTVLVEYHGEGFLPGAPSVCPVRDENLMCYPQGNFSTPPFWPAGHTPFCSCQDVRNNTYACVRTGNASANFRYCEFQDTVGFVEYFDLAADYFEMRNGAGALPAPVASQLHSKLAALHACSGANCNVY